MNFSTYRPLAMRTAKMFPTRELNLKHAALGLTTEVGELATIVKRHVIYCKMIDADHVHEELGDVCWYFALTALAYDMTNEELTAAAAACQHKVAQETSTMQIDELVLMLAGLSIGVIGATLEPERATEFRDATLNFIAISMLIIEHRICPMFKMSLDSVLDANIAKLRERFPLTYSDQLAEARADKHGLDARNS